MTKYETWREGQIKKVGNIQLKAEANLEKHAQQPFVEVVDPKTGKKRQMKRDVAQILTKRREVETSRLLFSVPDLSHIDWNN